MVCRNCGQEYDNRLPNCPRCGAPSQANVVYVQQPAPQQNNGMAIAGFVLSLLGFLSLGMSFILQLLGLIFSCVGVSKAKKMNGNGKGLSVAGIVLSVLAWIPGILMYVFVIGTAASFAGVM